MRGGVRRVVDFDQLRQELSDWAVAFKHGEVKHIYFVTETKGSMSSIQLRKIEECKIDCARKFFAGITTEQVKYDVVSDYAKLMNIVK